MYTSRRYSLVLAAGLLALAVAVTGGCKSKKDVPITSDMGDTSGSGVEEGSDREGLPNLDLTNVPFVPAPDLRPVYFDYDSYSLRPDALAALRENADIIKSKYTSNIIQVEGHCDERGTQEYNLALGERRALAVREHLMKLGVSGDRIVTISYGEELPAVPGHDESAWSKNRRCEFSRSQS